MSKEKTPVQECIDFIDQEIRDYKTLNMPKVVYALIPIKAKLESIRDNEEKKLFIDGYNTGKNDIYAKSLEDIAEFRYNEKHGTNNATGAR